MAGFARQTNICDIALHVWPPDGLPGSGSHFVGGLVHHEQALKVGLTKLCRDEKFVAQGDAFAVYIDCTAVYPKIIA